MFSSRCSTEEVPGIGSITGERRSSQASATWAGGGAVPLGDLGDRRRPARRGRRRERSPREERDAGSWQTLEHVSGAVAVAEVEAVLDGDDLDDRRAPIVELIDGDVGDADLADLALVLKLLQRPDRILVGDLRVGAVQLVEVDPLEPQSAQRALAGLPQVLGAPVGRPPARAGPSEPPLVAIRRSSG